jgi:SAM-dependent methyltransferase
VNEEVSTTRWDDIDAAADTAAFQSYLDRVTGLAATQAIKERSRHLLRSTAGDRLLDVGCGNGDDTRALGDSVGATASIVGVDNSVAMIEEARNRTDVSAATFIPADAHALSFDTDTFDGVRADRVLQHLADPRAAFGELVRVTRSSGRVVVTEPDWGSLVVTAPGIDSEVTRSILDPKWACVRHGRVGRRLRGRMADAGLTDVELDTGVLAFTDMETAESVLGLAGRVETVREHAPDGNPDARKWYEALKQADANDAFFASLTLFTIAGTKP